MSIKHRKLNEKIVMVNDEVLTTTIKVIVDIKIIYIYIYLNGPELVDILYRLKNTFFKDTTF